MEYPPVCKKHEIPKKLTGTQNGYSFWECLKCNEEDKNRLFILFTKDSENVSIVADREGIVTDINGPGYVDKTDIGCDPDHNCCCGKVNCDLCGYPDERNNHLT